jgi:tetratricopeptide (TPR) repeat protein
MAEQFSPEQHDETIFQDAVDALRRGDRVRAKELLTLLLKTDQNNPTYWVWMSASVDNTKERIYCLQTALKLDPENSTAKRGLILLGALNPDETVQPFPMNRPRAWEEKLLLANEKPKERGFRAIARSPIVRLAGVSILGLGLVAVVVFGFILPRRSNVRVINTNTPGPSPTFSPTPTIFGATAVATPTFFGPTPLWMFLPETYTPTPLYVNTQRAPESRDQYRSAQQAFAQGDWDAYIQNMEIIQQLEPNSADIYYYIGEAYRYKGETNNALEAYNEALKINPEFGAPYLGLARARLLQDPNVNIEYLFDEALSRDPNFGEVYIERARYYLFHNEPEDAIVDLDRVDEILPGSPEVQLLFSKAYLALDDKVSALKYAEQAYALDITNLEVYEVLGELYIENEEYQRAVESLEVFVVYENESSLAYALLGQAYFELKQYEASLANFDKAYAISPNGLRRFYIYRGLASLEVEDIPAAIEYLEGAYNFDEKSFDVNLGLVKAYFLNETFGTAFLKVETLNSIADTDEQKALALYWRALIQEKREEAESAIDNWQELLEMDPDAMTVEMREEAERHLRTMVTPTNTPKPSTPTKTATRGPTATKTPTPKGGTTPSPTRTRTPSPTPTK